MNNIHYENLSAYHKRGNPFYLELFRVIFSDCIDQKLLLLAVFIVFAFDYAEMLVYGRFKRESHKVGVIL